MSVFFLLFSFFSSAILIGESAQGAACCGGGFAAPALIAGDDKAVFTSTYAMTEVVVDNVDARGIWRKSDDHQKVQTFKIDGAHIFSDRWQGGFSIPVMQRSRAQESSSGFGDVSTMLGYEYLTDWSYNTFRPKGIGYLQIIFPTGKSRADSELGGLDSRGQGFWALGLGTLLTKALGKWDAFSSVELHRSFEKEINNSQISGTLKPGFGGQLGLGVGYNISDYRIGSSLTWSYEEAIEMANAGSRSIGSEERYATGVLSASYMANEAWAGTLSYSDQTLFGSPMNTSLGRGVAIQIQRRLGR